LGPRSFRNDEPRSGHAPVSLARMPGDVWISAIRPAYLTARDFPWLSALFDERERFVGRKRGEWKLRVDDGLPLQAPHQKLRVALRVLDRLSQDQAQSVRSAKLMRATLFREAARSASRAAALAAAAAKLGVAEQAMMGDLFSDLTDERLLTPIAPTSPEQLALLCNGELITQLLARALRVRLDAHGKVRAVVRHAKLMGLLCKVTPGTSRDAVSLELSGPFSLFRHTRIYARALSSLIPRLVWCHSFRLEAECVLGGGRIGRLTLRSGDPIFPARELPAFDSKTEERFAKAFGKVAPDWDVIREPVAIEAGGSLVFPDFELRHRTTGERWLLEIVGYWTPEYLQKKLTMLRAAKIERLILCIDEERCCTEEARDLGGYVVCYRRKVDPRAVLSIVDPAASASLPEPKATRLRAGVSACRKTSAKTAGRGHL